MKILMQNGQAVTVNGSLLTYEGTGTGGSDGTVTTVAAGTGLTTNLTNNAAITVQGTISLADYYGDTKNPYNQKGPHYVLAGPASGTNNAVPTFRQLVAADIPPLSYLTTHQDISGKADLASPALTGTPTAPTAAIGTSTTQIATTAFVQNAVAQGIAANDAMVFKGTVGNPDGSILQLPKTNYKKGWTYRVANAGNYAGEKCEIGDLIIAVVDGPSSGTTDINANWTKIEHNIDGAVYMGDANGAIGSLTQPVYVDANGLIHAGTALGNLAYVNSLNKDDVGLSNLTNEAQIPKSIGTTQGDIIYWATANTPVRLGAGANGSILRLLNGVPAWSSETNTDTLVKQNEKVNNVNYNLLFSAETSASFSNGTAAEAGYNSNITVNPATKSITATNFIGNASSATVLQTSRTINGTSFNGSTDIVTVNWGAARNISISDYDNTNTGTAVSVDGSSAATLKLPSIIKATIQGNASTATKLSSAQLLYVNLANASTTTTFEGGSNAAEVIGVDGALAVSNGGTGLTTVTNVNSVVIGNSTSATGAMQTVASADGAFYATAANEKPQFGTLPVPQGGTGKTSWTQWGIVYAPTTTTLANIGAGTSGQILQSNGNGAPSWISATDSNVGSTIVKRDASGSFSGYTITATNNFVGNLNHQLNLTYDGTESTNNVSFNNSNNVTFSLAGFVRNVDDSLVNLSYSSVKTLTDSTQTTYIYPKTLASAIIFENGGSYGGTANEDLTTALSRVVYTNTNQTISGEKTFNSITTFGGNILPSTTNNKSLGNSSKRWSNLYIGTADSYGSTSQPIYWNNGVPAPCNYSIIISSNEPSSSNVINGALYFVYNNN